MVPREKVEANLGLVHFVLNDLLLRRPRLRRVRDDLLQEGVLGLIRALEDHDPAKGTIGTYAPWWIGRYIQAAIRNLGPISLNHGPASHKAYPAGVPTADEFEFDNLRAPPWLEQTLAAKDNRQFAQAIRDEMVSIRKHTSQQPRFAERDVEIFMRYRFDGEMDLRAIGKEYAMSHARAHQIVNTLERIFERIRGEFATGRRQFDVPRLFVPERTPIGTNGNGHNGNGHSLSVLTGKRAK